MSTEHEPTVEEREAVRLRFRHQNPEAPEGAEPTSEQFARLLGEIRDRAAAIEAEALKMLARATRNPATRSRLWSRHAQIVLLPMLAVVSIFLLAWVVISVLTGN